MANPIVLYKGCTTFVIERVDPWMFKVTTPKNLNHVNLTVTYAEPQEFTFALANDVVTQALFQVGNEPIKVNHEVEFYASTNCIYCGCGNIEGGSLDLDEDEYSQTMICPDCGGSYRDVYTLSRQELVNSPRPDMN